MAYNKAENKIKFDYNNMLNTYIGDKGLSERDFANENLRCNDAFNFVAENRGKGWLGWTELPYNQSSIISDILETAKDIRKKFDYFVVLGIGGSALGPVAVFQSLCHLHYNDLPKSTRKAPKFYVEDNIDPERMMALLDVIDVSKTMFNVVTKSGATSETMSQYLIITDILKEELGENYKNNIIATTSENSGNLIKIAKAEGFKTFFIPDGVGGRFSELCPVGLLPAAVLKIDIKGLLDGAAYMDKLCNKPAAHKNPALMAALLQFLAMKNGYNISVMMPYADSLKYMADWYCQLWGESLGKAVDNNGNKVNVGQTPVKALGVTDQHSQVQLYTEGPYDKVVTFIAVEDFRNEVLIPDGAENYPNVNFLCGATLGQLLNTERIATEYALLKSGRLNNTIILPEVNAFTIGQLLMFFQLQTAYAGAMLNIDTFNQPGVEEGKNATYALFDRVGYEDKKKELSSMPSKNDKYII
ncbi:MAG: glucose-6-phosphate isomerase [Clostridia bacterium]